MKKIILCLILFLFIVVNSYALNIDNVKIAFVSKDYQLVIKEGEKILADGAKAQGIDELYYYLALSYMKEGNYLRASDIFEIIIGEFKDSRFKNDAQLSLADTYFLKGDYAQARKMYRQLSENNDYNNLKAVISSRLSQCSIDDREVQNLECYYSVQAGSFASNANAQNLKSELSQRGFDSFVEEADSNGKTTYRVKVGKLRSKAEAVKLETTLKDSGYPTKICP